MNLIISVILLYAVSVIHEFGHFLAAKWAGIRIFEVCIGQGPLLFMWKSPHTGTLYTLRLLPWSGHTAMPIFPNRHKRRAFRGKSLCEQPVMTQAIVMSAGFLAESLAAMVLFICRMGNVGENLNPAWTFGVCLYGWSAIANMIPIGSSDGARIHNLAQFGCMFRIQEYTSTRMPLLEHFGEKPSSLPNCPVADADDEGEENNHRKQV